MPNADGPAGLFTEQKKQNEGEKEKRKRNGLFFQEFLISPSVFYSL